jgi:superfamily I DNA/RNA helicase
MLLMTAGNIVGMSSHVNDVRSCSIYAAVRAIKRHVSNERFDHILLDEYQDTNRLQFSILHRMRSLNHNLTVVGDDAQSIYSFRAAEVRNILDFPAEFPEATVVTLERLRGDSRSMTSLAGRWCLTETWKRRRRLPSA